MRLKKGDEVIVITGAEKGKIGKIMTVLPKEDKVVVSGVNIVRKRKRAADGSGFSEVEFPFHISNVAFYDGVSKKPSKIKYSVDASGSKVRVASASNTIIAS
ncbi:MAG: 50S ribosomal protein L24 [Alphaproteobacteria bacterium]|nr:MAG: 50S ribosomal protein L24 [Alphaproteobacteria bacterium]TAE81741.1 MAG: 50S ribosomal protein L24 [Alphaproteobacteria bacterium]TAF13226.1 MAG: 50S ribosomal protein L24 [Alphaproteobacteria bacterium]TAF40922.1 MAG: 50S ribosomal protein L24 [Alphaproteobacteria bacterium]TAF76878.1 MAG: 50S ribosomal protein L24 [Alphaproteobacteria bacterium]